MLVVPTDKRQLLDFTQDLIETCRVSAAARMAVYRLFNLLTETGRYDGSKSLINCMHWHLDRTAAHLFSPVELKFSMDFDAEYPDHILKRGSVVAKHVTRHWERKNIDMLFQRAAFEGLKYGAAILKQWPKVEGLDEYPEQTAKIVMPWQFGVYNEAENDINKQYVLCETATLTMPDVWRRIWHLPDAKKLYDRVKSHAKHGEMLGEPQSMFHSVLSTSQLQFGVQQANRPIPGGIVTFGNEPNYPLMGPQIAADVVQAHELWVNDAEMGDYTTIILIEPDIIVAPYHKKQNILVGKSGSAPCLKGQHPYSLIQPNETTNWFWGRSELTDIAEPQSLLSTWADDTKRLFGLQIDKILGFVGNNSLTDEAYAQARLAGFFNLEQGSTINDLTPKFPPEVIPMLKFVIEIINWLSGFPEIMQGKGEPGVRAGVHASTLLKTASPTLRDRSLLVERQCATAAHLTTLIFEAKDPTSYWTDGKSLESIEQSKFRITDLPEDWRITVDSHSSSPIFQDENQQVLFALRRQGDVDGEFLLDNLPIPNKEQAKAGLAKRQKQQAEMMQNLLKQYPEAGEKIALKMIGGGGKR